VSSFYLRKAFVTCPTLSVGHFYDADMTSSPRNDVAALR